MEPVSQWGQSVNGVSQWSQSVNGTSQWAGPSQRLRWVSQSMWSAGGQWASGGVSQWGVSQRKRVGQPASHGPVANPAVGDYAR